MHETANGEAEHPLTTAEIAPGFGALTITKMDEFRREFETLHGATPVRQYASMAPRETQDWLLRNHPQHYFDMLPPFMSAFFAALARDHAATGKLDDLNNAVLEVFVRNRGRMTNSPPPP